MPTSLCQTCAHVKEIVSGRGSRFWMCERHRTDPRFSKYPPQPVVRCAGHAEARSALSLELHRETFAVCRLEPRDPIPEWARGEPVFVARTAEELSVVCGEDSVPAGVTAERGWRCLRVAGTLAFEEVGVIAALTAPLAAAEISAFVVSSFDTDYLLVRAADLQGAIAALERAGHPVRPR